MRACKLALCAAIAVLCCPVARAQVPKFTIVSITREPPGPIAPGGKFKLKVTVRNDGDTIPANRRFDFIFTSPDAVAIAPPTGTPALFFGYCPGATPTNMVCQCFAPWEKGQTVEMETEVTVGSTARGTSTVTFRVSSGTVAETASVTVQIVLAGPDLVPHVDASYWDSLVRGQGGFFKVRLNNIGNMPTQGQIKVTASLSAGLEFGGNLSGFATFTGDKVMAPGEYWHEIVPGLTSTIWINELGVQSIAVTVSGGGDVEPSNNSETTQLFVIREDPDPLNRLVDTKALARILGR